jgi:hypothetical protein
MSLGIWKGGWLFSALLEESSRCQRDPPVPSVPADSNARESLRATSASIQGFEQRA